MRRREPAAPPVIPGFTPIELIGFGGYADVYLYEQHVPNRQVAVKVLTAGALDSDKSASFTAEANLMARVSAHPFIVQIFQADIARDGRPYLVMEYYPNANLAERARSERMSVAEVLRTGVQLASAVETAHRLGVLHRDIKPANVLTSEFHRPGLTDFGIASAHGPNVDSNEGLSIPWSPPETFGDAVLDVRADVYSLAATLYTLLASRSPFEIPGGDNSELALISRIERNPVPAIGRPDVPPSFERLLANAMSKNPAHRPASAVELARMLQGVEEELRLGVTQIELAGARTTRSRDEAVDEEATHVRGVRELHAQQPPSDRATSTPNHVIDEIPSRPVAPAGPRERHRRMLPEPDVGDTIHREVVMPSPSLPTPASGRSRRRMASLGAAAAVLLGLLLTAAVLATGDGTPPADDDDAASEVNDGLEQATDDTVVMPDTVGDVTGSSNDDGTFTFEWEAPTGDDLRFAVTEDGSDAPALVDGTTFVASTSCVEVETVAPSGLVSTPVRGCAD